MFWPLTDFGRVWINFVDSVLANFWNWAREDWDNFVADYYIFDLESYFRFKKIELLFS